ncbi:response regulator [Egbenema bharatensis]|uniref:response regulator n=1 Tax=Egbenema bharatensis TaxID=3463334 RepID=UPI003A850F71
MELAWLIEKLDKPIKHVDGEVTLCHQTKVWKIHLIRGQVLYIAGGEHPTRRWSRALQQHSINWNWSTELPRLPDKHNWECQLLNRGISQSQLSLVRAKLIVRSTAQEGLFELSSQTHMESQWMPNEYEIWDSCRSIALSSWEMQAILGRATRMRQEWQEAGLDHLSPTLAPALTQQDLPAELLPVPQQYLNGELTLWDIALRLEQSVVGVTCSLIPWLEKGVLQFKAVEDCAPLTAEQPIGVTSPGATSPGATSPGATSPGVTLPPAASKPPPVQQQPLIACIDDSPVLAHTLKKILVSSGYQMLSIPEPMRGFAQLIEHKPDLILLDLLLPNADGYSICKFLRDTPVFKKTPIIILTGQSSSIDRVRAMLAGATEFLSKPPHADELLQMIQKYIDPKAMP